MLNKYDLSNILGSCTLQELQEVKDEVDARINTKIINRIDSINETLKGLKPIKNLYLTIDGLKTKVHNDIKIDFEIEK